MAYQEVLNAKCLTRLKQARRSVHGQPTKFPTYRAIRRGTFSCRDTYSVIIIIIIINTNAYHCLTGFKVNLGKIDRDFRIWLPTRLISI